MVRFYLAKCWIDNFHVVCPVLCGINWFHDWLLILCVFFHNSFIAPFAKDDIPFPLILIESYEDDQNEIENLE